MLFFNTSQKQDGWLDDRHGPSPILYDTAPLFVYTDQPYVIAFSFDLMFTIVVGFLSAMASCSAPVCWLSHMKQ